MVYALPLWAAFDKMMSTLEIQSRAVCKIAKISEGRLSTYRSGKKPNMETNTLEALLEAAQSINPRAREVFADCIAGKRKTIEEMTLAEKGALMMALGKSIRASKNTDLKSKENA